MTGLGFVPALPRATRPRGPWGWGSAVLIQCGLHGASYLMCDACADAELTLTRTKDGDGDGDGDGDEDEDEDVVTWCVGVTRVRLSVRG